MENLRNYAFSTPITSADSKQFLPIVVTNTCSTLYCSFSIGNSFHHYPPPPS